MEEALVILICMNGKGCDQVFNTYTYYRPSIVEMVETNERRIKKIIPAYILEYAGPVVASSTGIDISVKINRNFSLKNNKNVTQLIFKKEF